MSAPSRTPQEVLGELEHDLQTAFRRRSARPLHRVRRLNGWRRVGLAVAVVATVGVSTAAATRSIFSTAPPIPQLARVAAIVARGEGGAHGAHAWQLLVSRCSRPAGAVSVLLRTAAGGAGSPCGPLLQPATALFGAGGAIAFGAVPAGTKRVELTLGRTHVDVEPVDADADGLRAAGLPAHLRFYVTTLPPDATVTAATAFDGSGHLLLACQEQRCTTP